jgi:hypothetical protein
LQAAHARSALDFDVNQPEPADLRNLAKNLGFSVARPEWIERLRNEGVLPLLE